MKYLSALSLFVILTTVFCQNEKATSSLPVVLTKPRPVGIIYLIEVLRRPEIQNYNEELENTINRENTYENFKVPPAFTQISGPEEKQENNRNRRSAGYGGKGGYGGGGCNVCGGGGGGYPGGFGGGGFGGGGGYGASGSWSQASASSGSWGSGGGKGGGKYGK